MARKITDGAPSATVHQLNPKKRNAGSKLAQSAKAAQAAAEAVSGKAAAKEPEETIIEKDFLPAGDAPAPVTAPSFGANEPDEGVFLKHVNILRDQSAKIDEAKLVLKNLKKKNKDLRLAAREAGLVMGELDRALKDLDTEQVDLEAREQRYLQYMEWLGRPLGLQGALPGLSLPTDTERDLNRWFTRGNQDGRLGKPRTAPSGCTGDFLQSYLRGHDEGQAILMRASPLTASAFNGDGSLKDNADGKAAAVPAILVLQEADFVTGTALDDANLKTVLPARREAWAAAERVIALFGTRRRILREPNEDGTIYQDTGEPDAEITDPEPATPEDLAAAGIPSASEFA